MLEKAKRGASVSFEGRYSRREDPAIRRLRQRLAGRGGWCGGIGG
jgi:hypothetical protein